MADKKSAPLPALLNSVPVRKRFTEILDKGAPSFMQTLMTVYNGNPKLRECDSPSILSAAMLAASLNLPVAPSLGYAYIVPYKDQATFQIGYKGMIQLAMRSNQFRRLNTSAVCEGQIRDIDFVTGEVTRGKKISDKVVGYIAYMELKNGFEKALFMTTAEMQEYAKKYSQGYAYDQKSGRKSSVWSSNFDAMAKKTVLKRLLNTFAPMSVEASDLSIALQADQSVVTENAFTYVDNGGDSVAREDVSVIEPLPEEPATEIVNTETGELSVFGNVGD